ncbi:MAG TPA: hypothetical protein VK184_18640 [Nostocaceae cyanobacterium]|nr:hypothetical protein [Nostocaceae cyanobacterium]
MSLKNLQENFEQIRPLLTLILITWLLASLGLGWLVNSLLIILAFISLAPVVAFFVFRWWLQKNMVVDKCPVCSHELTGLNNSQLQCPNCGEQLIVQNGQLRRFAPEGIIDVTAVDVSSQALED